jgi:hypothetical protein
LDRHDFDPLTLPPPKARKRIQVRGPRYVKSAMKPFITVVVAVDDIGINVAWLTKMDYCPE